MLLTRDAYDNREGSEAQKYPLRWPGRRHPDCFSTSGAAST
jgi:hypothetical protein